MTKLHSYTWPLRPSKKETFTRKTTGHKAPCKAPIQYPGIIPISLSRWCKLSLVPFSSAMFIHIIKIGTRSHTSIRCTVTRSRSRIRCTVTRSHTSIRCIVTRSHSGIRCTVTRSHTSIRCTVTRSHSSIRCTVTRSHTGGGTGM